MNVVAYYRVSTQRQGQSGLGLEAQRAKVAEFAKQRGHVIVGEAVEVQSGKDDGRPKLKIARALAERKQAAIVVAKLDRLARSVKLIEDLMASGQDVLFCDLPDLPPGPTGRFMVQLMAAIAQLEAGMISERTKAALAAAKARGVKLGGARNTIIGEAARDASAISRIAQADKFAMDLLPTLQALAEAGIRSQSAIARALNEAGIKPQRAAQWSSAGVGNVLARISAIREREVQVAKLRHAQHDRLFA